MSHTSIGVVWNKWPCSFPIAAVYQLHLIHLHKHLAGKQCHQIPVAGHVQVLLSPCVLFESTDVARHGERAWRWELCWVMDAPQAPSGSRKASRAARRLSAVTHSSWLRLIIPCFGSWSYSAVLPSMGIYNKLSKSLKKEGSRGTSPSRGNCLSQFITNEPLVSVTHWWGHMKYPLWACCLQWLALSIGRDSARCLT